MTTTPTTIVLWLQKKDLPKGLEVKKTPSGLYWAVYFNNRLIYPAGKRWECYHYLQENPRLMNTAREYNRQQEAINA